MRPPPQWGHISAGPAVCQQWRELRHLTPGEHQAGGSSSVPNDQNKEKKKKSGEEGKKKLIVVVQLFRRGDPGWLHQRCFLGDISQSAQVTTWFRRDFVGWVVGTVQVMRGSRTQFQSPEVSLISQSAAFPWGWWSPSLREVRSTASTPQDLYGLRHLSCIDTWEMPSSCLSVRLKYLTSGQMLCKCISQSVKSGTWVFILLTWLCHCFWVFVFGIKLIVGMVWMSFPILHVLQPSEMDFHLIIHTSCGLSSYMVDFFFFFYFFSPTGIRKSSM